MLFVNCLTIHNVCILSYLYLIFIRVTIFILTVHKRLYGFCETQHVLYDNQYGFRPKHSTIDAVSKCSAHVMASLEDNLTTLAVFLDLSKAFDTMDHNILLKQLNLYGIRGIALE